MESCVRAAAQSRASRMSPAASPRARRSTNIESDLAALKFGELLGIGSFGRVYKGEPHCFLRKGLRRLGSCLGLHCTQSLCSCADLHRPGAVKGGLSFSLPWQIYLNTQ